MTSGLGEIIVGDFTVASIKLGLEIPTPQNWPHCNAITWQEQRFTKRPRMIRRTEISIETRRVLTIRRRQPLTRVWCEACLAEVRMITPTEAAAIARVVFHAISRWIEGPRC